MIRRRALLTAGLAALMPRPAVAHFPGKKARLTSTVSDRGAAIAAYVMQAPEAPAPAVLLVPPPGELEPYVRWYCAEFGRRGFMTALPVPAEGGDAAVMDAARSWFRWLKAHFQSTGKAAVVGVGDGCGLAARVAASESARAAVLLDPVPDDPDVAALAGRLPALMLAAGDRRGQTPLEVVWLDAAPGFMNFQGTARRGGADKEAFERTLEFLTRHLGR